MKNVSEGQNIIPFSDFVQEVKHPALQQVDAYWEALRKNQLAPFRADVDPRGIEKALEYAFILERIAPGHARFRIAGMHLVTLMGMEVRGMPLATLFVPKAREPLSDALEQVFTEPEKATLSLSAERGIGKPPIDGQLMLLPMKSDPGEISRVLGCLVSEGTTGRTPRRFHIRKINRRRIISDEKQNPATNPKALSFAETQMPYKQKGPDAMHPALRLVKSDT